MPPGSAVLRIVAVILCRGGTRFSLARIPVPAPQSGSCRRLLFSWSGNARRPVADWPFSRDSSERCGRGPSFRRAFDWLRVYRFVAAFVQAFPRKFLVLLCFYFLPQPFLNLSRAPRLFPDSDSPGSSLAMCFLSAGFAFLGFRVDPGGSFARSRGSLFAGTSIVVPKTTKYILSIV